MALISRKDGMRTRVMKRVTKKNLRNALDDIVDKNADLLTDELQAYKKLGRAFRNHATVNHSRGEYARGIIHINTAESFFALLKRGVHGTFHHVSEGHLQRYADEFAFRWNNRKISDAERTKAALKLAPGCRLTYAS